MPSGAADSDELLTDCIICPLPDPARIVIRLPPFRTSREKRIKETRNGKRRYGESDETLIKNSNHSPRPQYQKLQRPIDSETEKDRERSRSTRSDSGIRRGPNYLEKKTENQSFNAIAEIFYHSKADEDISPNPISHHRLRREREQEREET